MKKHQTFMIISDSHGDLRCENTTNAALEFCRDFKPDIKVHLGDVWDFACLRAGAKDTDDERNKSLNDDWLLGEWLLNEFFKGKSKERTCLLGNHDHRLWTIQRTSSGLVRKYCEDAIESVQAVMRQNRVAWHKYGSRNVSTLGDRRLLHGIAHGVGAHRKHAAAYGNCIFGHIHTGGDVPFEDLNGSRAQSVPCLCQLEQNYNYNHLTPLRQYNGWCYGLVIQGVTLIYEAKKLPDGTFYTPTIK